MSILIKGMDKPTDCGVCPFEDFGYCNVKGERNSSESGIDTDCPLIEVADRKTDIAEAYLHGWNDALDAVKEGKFVLKDEQTEPQNLRKITQDLRKTSNSSEKPNNCDEPQAERSE